MHETKTKPSNEPQYQIETEIEPQHQNEPPTIAMVNVLTT